MTPRLPTLAAMLAIAVCSALQTQPADVAHPPAGDPHRDPLFTMAYACAVCHIAAPGATAMKSKAGADVSPYYTWQATMMANSFRDPYFRAQLQKETAAAGEQVQELCLRCHTPMVHHQRMHDGEAPPRLAEAVDELEADDGVSCTVCHMIAADGLGERRTFSGKPKFNDERLIYGPFDDVETRPMRGQVRYTPTKGEHIRSAGLCASCHTLFTEHHGTPFPEQTPYLEWRNSIFNDEVDGADPKTARSCQQCHMPALPKTRIARTPMGFDFRIPEREGYRSHAFVGGNAFMLDILREHRDDLFVEAEDEQLLAMAKATREQLATATAKLTLDGAALVDGELRFDVAVENLTGHKFPTGYPARRAWLRVEVLVDDEVVFASGACDDDGRIVGVDDELRIPHVDEISRPTDVVVYEMVAHDPDGEPTTYLTKMVGKRKDTRLLPKGFRLDGPIVKDIEPVGVGDDPNFVGGGDRVTCRVPVGASAAGRWRVRVSLLYQTVPPVWVDALRTVEAEEAKRFVGYYDAASKRPELVAVVERRAGEVR
ncbi:MAG: hypothetical protein KAI24_11385 [Planctomycetes bacterium]|nr:hypothetical protein [Planctomycetota bacterium]